jgi:hypothetical protein
MAMWPHDRNSVLPGDDDRIDRAIDEVARQMTAGSPGADLKARVLARIGEPRPVWRSPWILAPIATAAVVLLIVLAWPHQGPDDAERATAAVTPPSRAAQRPPVAPAPAQTAQSNSATAETARTPRAVPTAVRHRPVRYPATAAPSTIDALAPPPLEVASIQLSALPDADSIHIDPLEAITSIELAPLGPLDVDDQGERR